MTVAELHALEEPQVDCVREWRLEELLRAGYALDDATEIAAVLSISQETVHTYTRRATSKLHARTRTQAIVKAAAAGWLDDV